MPINTDVLWQGLFGFAVLWVIITIVIGSIGGIDSADEDTQNYGCLIVILPLVALLFAAAYIWAYIHIQVV